MKFGQKIAKRTGTFIWCGITAFALASGTITIAQHPATPTVHLEERLRDAEGRIGELERMQRLPAVSSSDEYPVSLREGDTASLTSRIEALEKELQKQADAAAKSKSDAAAKPTQKWTGRIHTDFWSFPGDDDGTNFFENGNTTAETEDRFLFRRLRLGLAGDLFETMEYKIELDFAQGDGTVIKDAFLGWNDLPVFQTLLIGNQKRPYGLDHLNSSRYNVFLERPFVVEAFNQDARRLGICSYGVSEDLAYNWRYGAYASTDLQTTGQFIVADSPGQHHYQSEFAGRFANTFWYDETSDGRGYAHWAVSGTTAGVDGTAGAASTARFRTRPEARTSSRWIDTGTIVGAETYQLLGLEGVINVGAVQWVGEYMQTWVQRNAASDVTFQGGYTYLSYFLTGEHIPWERESGQLGRVKPFENFFLVDRCKGDRGYGMGAWQVAARYSYGDFTDDTILGGVGSSVSVALNWHWNPYAKVQLDYIYGDIEDRCTQNISGATGLPGGAAGLSNGNYNVIGTRFLVDF